MAKAIFHTGSFGTPGFRSKFKYDICSDEVHRLRCMPHHIMLLGSRPVVVDGRFSSVVVVSPRCLLQMGAGAESLDGHQGSRPFARRLQFLERDVRLRSGRRVAGESHYIVHDVSRPE